MLRSVRELVGYTLLASDGEIGACADFLFDDRDWVIRYMVADTRRWLPGRKVLISPAALAEPDWNTRLFPVQLGREQIKDSPALEEHAPVSRTYERNYHEFFGYGLYWEGPELWGARPDPSGILHPVPSQQQAPLADLEVQEGHIRSINEVHGYDIQGSDDQIGTVDDYVVDDRNWAIEWLVVDTRRWLPGGKVLVSPEWVESVEWVKRRVSIAMTVDQIRNSPKYDPATPINREYEARLYDFHGRPRRRG
jgi:hypothetical protein